MERLAHCSLFLAPHLSELSGKCQKGDLEGGIDLFQNVIKYDKPDSRSKIPVQNPKELNPNGERGIWTLDCH